MKISVIIPTYKPGNYIYDCLNSLDSQTLNKSDYEIIIILNGCNEPWNSNIKCWISNHPKLNVTLIHSDYPGVSMARNIGLDNAKGQYIAFIDDDDFISNNYLEALLSNSDEKSICVSNVLTYNPADNELGDDYITRAFKINEGKKLSLFKGRKFLSSSCCKIIPQKIIDQIRFNEKIKIGEDSLFMAKISNNIKAIKLASPDCIYYRRLRKDSASRKKITLSNHLKNRLTLIFNYLNLLFTFKYNVPLILSRIVAVIISIKVI